MEITAEKINKLYAMYDELDRVEEESTKAINDAKRFKGNRVVITRRNGQSQEVTEEMLWDEVWNLGPKCEAGNFLRAKYAYAFDVSDMHATKAAELRKFAIAELGVDSQRVKLRDIVKLVEAMVDYKLKGQDK